MDEPSHTRAGHHAVTAWTASVVIAVFAFALSFLTLGAIENDQFVSLSRAHQVLHGDWPVRDFADPGMPLGYLLPAAAAALAGPTLLTDAVLALVLFAVAVALTFVLVRRASGSSVLALAAAGLVVLLPPRLYNSSKVLVHVAAIAVAWRYADRPRYGRLLALSAWTAVGFLVRHDYAVYIAGGALVLIVVQHAGAPRTAVRHLALYGAAAIVLALPWLLYVHWAAGLGDYVASAVRFSAAERRRTMGSWPLLYYGIALVPVTAVIAVRRAAGGVGPAHVAFAGSMVFLLDLVLLRDVPSARVPDVLAPTLIIGAALAGRFVPAQPLRAGGIAALIALIIAATLLLVQRGNGVPRFDDILRRWEHVAGRLSRADPTITPKPAHAPLLAFIRRCTSPDQRVLVIGFAPEIPVLAQRSFAGGHPGLWPGYYEDAADVRVTRMRLAREHVAAVVMLENAETLQTSWPAIARDLQARRFQPYALRTEAETIELWLPPRSEASVTDAATGLPCVASPPN